MCVCYEIFFLLLDVHTYNNIMLETFFQGDKIWNEMFPKLKDFKVGYTLSLAL